MSDITQNNQCKKEESNQMLRRKSIKRLRKYHLPMIK